MYRLYFLMLTTTSLLLLYHQAQADTHSLWQCGSGPDQLFQTCPQDGKDPASMVENILPHTGPGIDYSLPSCIAVASPDGLTHKERTMLRQSSPIEIEADEAVARQGRKSVLHGNVSVKRADQSLQADDVTYDKSAGQIEASGEIEYADSDIRVTARQAHLDFNGDEQTFAETKFYTRAPYSRGSAARIKMQQAGRIRLDDVRHYTTCPPGRTVWQLEVEKLVLDDNTGRGEGKNVKIEFLDIPILYTPYINFPIDDRRQTGLLTPRFSHSDSRGAEILVPVYWNIAPHHDATLQPRYMSERGLQFGVEYRYLGENDRGQINLEYLGSDDQYTGPGDNNRWALHYQHNGVVGNWMLDTRIHRVSDNRYFEDLGSGPALSGQRHLENRITLGRRADNWSIYGMLQSYQTIDSDIQAADHPYERMPHIRLDARTEPFADGLVAGIQVEYTDFDKDNAVTGQRADIYPGITYSHERPGYYIRPRLGVRHTAYSLHNHAGGPSSPDRSVPILSVDSGLFYERFVKLFDQSMLQTLEPRFYYLRIPERRQSQIPVFDTGRLDYNSSALFSENRFSGIDRIGDTEQVSVGITSRFTEQSSGREKLTMTLGQIYYFRDRNVTLPGDLSDTDNSSPLIGEVRYRPHRRFMADALLHWRPETGETERAIYRLKYQPADNRVVNLAYRHRMDRLRQTSLSFFWPLDRVNRWHGLWRWNYSIKYNRTLDALIGVEYEGCCWKTRLAARRRANGTEDDFDTSVFFEIELKGLGSIGDETRNLLQAARTDDNYH